MDQVLLTARVAPENGGFIAKLEQLSLEGSGDSVQAAQDELILVLRSWIETQDGQDSLEQSLAEAGFPGVEEETEVQLEFLD
ncbi:MAG TPA: hypothetical protein EYM38_05570 [Dehalococcoidia bacterium]|jgi:hypothetical protein|nr:hypothetical protein [Dehalococcoidia bacterium]